MKKKLFSILKLILSLGLGIGLVYWFVNQMTPEQKQETINAFKRANYLWLALVPAIGFLSNYHRTQRWRQLLKATGHNPRFLNTFLSVMIMYFANLGVPRLGDVLRCGILTKYENVPLDKTLGTMVVERMLDALFLLGLGGLLFLFEGKRMYNFFAENIIGKKEASAEPSLAGQIVPIAILLSIIIFVIYILRKHGLEKLKAIVQQKIKGLINGVLSIKNVDNPLLLIFHSVAMWTCYLMMTYLSFRCIPETASLSILAALACLFAGAFAVVATPGGIGIYPIFIRSVLLLYGVDEVYGGAYGTLSWATQTVGALVGGLLSLLFINILNNKKVAVPNHG